MPIPALTTARLIIRPYTNADLDARWHLTHEAFGATPRESIHDWLTWTLLSYRQLAALGQPPYGDYAIALRSSDEAIGSIGLVPSIIPWGALDPTVAHDDPARTRVTPEFGLFWAMRTAHQRQGYTTEAARVFVDWLQSSFVSNGVTRLVATTEHANAASQAVMRRLGMTLRHNTASTPPWLEVVGVLTF